MEFTIIIGSLATLIIILLVLKKINSNKKQKEIRRKENKIKLEDNLNAIKKLTNKSTTVNKNNLWRNWVMSKPKEIKRHRETKDLYLLLTDEKVDKEFKKRAICTFLFPCDNPKLYLFVWNKKRTITFSTGYLKYLDQELLLYTLKLLKLFQERLIIFSKISYRNRAASYYLEKQIYDFRSHVYVQLQGYNHCIIELMSLLKDDQYKKEALNLFNTNYIEFFISKDKLNYIYFLNLKKLEKKWQVEIYNKIKKSIPALKKLKAISFMDINTILDTNKNSPWIMDDYILFECFRYISTLKIDTFTSVEDLNSAQEIIKKINLKCCYNHPKKSEKLLLLIEEISNMIKRRENEAEDKIKKRKEEIKKIEQDSLKAMYS